MSTPSMSALKSLLAAATAIALAATAAAQTKSIAQGPNLGQPATPADIAAWDIDIPPSGRGLPPGSGTPSKGETVYKQHCASCHGPKGEGKPNDRLVGGQGSLPGDKPAIKTVGSYWPYATTVFDYVRRSMPWHAPQSLANDDVYAVTAYILMLNNIIGPDDVMDAQSMPAVKMPNRDGFRSHYKAKK